MNFVLHSAPFSVSGDLENHRIDDVSGSRSEFSSLSLMARIWVWLSQIWGSESFGDAAESVFHLGPNDTLHRHRYQNFIPADRLNRRQRRLLGWFIRAGLSPEQIDEWAQARRKARRFQTALARYYRLVFLRPAALRRSRFIGNERGIGAICNAPLTPD